MKPKKNLENRADLEILLNQFYDRVKVDPLIGPVFIEIAQVHWEEHLPKIYNFWESLLFGADNYRGRPFPPHIPLNLKLEHFERWLTIFFTTTDELFEGQKAEEIKARALNIGRNFLANIKAIETRDQG